MALSFNGTTSYLEYVGNLAGAFPVSMFVRFKPNPASQTAALVSFGVWGAGQEISILQVANILRGTERDAALVSKYAQTENAPTNAWWPAMGSFARSPGQLRRVKLGSGSIASNTETSGNVIADFNRFRIGARGYADELFFTGEIAEVALWSSELSSTDYDSIYAGALPETVSAGTLIDVWPLLMQGAAQVGIVNGTVLTAYNTTQGGTHPVTRSATDATASGVTLTGTSSLTPGTATGGSGAVDATADGVMLTGTATLTPGAASGGASGSFVSSPMYSSGILQAGVALDWTWYPGAIGAAPTAELVHGSGATAGDGTLTMPGLPAGAGFYLAQGLDLNSEVLVAFEYGTVT